MLKPAICYKEEMEKKFAEVIYEPDYFYYVGYPHGHNISKIEPKDNVYQWAVVDKEDKVVGYIAYQYCSENDCIQNFGLYSFDKGNVLVAKDLFHKMEELIKKYRRVEWRMIGGNPVEKSYDAFCKRHNGRKVVLREVIKNSEGEYVDEVFYEILRKDVKL